MGPRPFVVLALSCVSKVVLFVRYSVLMLLRVVSMGFSMVGLLATRPIILFGMLESLYSRVRLFVISVRVGLGIVMIWPFRVTSVVTSAITLTSGRLRG